MLKLTSLRTVELKNIPNIKESTVQDFIFEHPEVLGLGDLIPIMKEKTQSSGGRLDILLGDDKDKRYEVEVQLGETDPSHIIRTIEYWEKERKHSKKYKHIAVIVAEKLNNRFFNVISLFGETIPLIAIQMSAIKNGDNIDLAFIKVVDSTETDKDEDEQNLVTDRSYWEKRTSPKMMKNVDEIFTNLGDLVAGYELKYNKFYIGLKKDDIVRNFIVFKPHKQFLYLVIKCDENNDVFQKIEKAGLGYCYDSSWNECGIKLNDADTYKKHKKLLDELVVYAKKYKNISEED